MADSQADIAIITDDPGWHGKQIKKSLAKRGFEASFVRLQDCHFDLSTDDAHIEIPGFAKLPKAVFVRGVPGGSLEQVVYYLDVLHGLEHLGVPVFNNTRALERSVDKGMTSFLLKSKDIPTPNSIFSSDLHYISNKIHQYLSRGSRVVVKPIFGSQGKGVQLITSKSDFIDYEFMHGVMYVQEYVDAGQSVGVDYRVFIVGDEVITSMKRTGESWITNVAQGGKVESVQLNENIQQMALDAVKVTGLDYSGVDLIKDKHGQFWVTEVNSVPAWKGLQQTTSINLSDVIADGFLSYSGLN